MSFENLASHHEYFASGVWVLVPIKRWAESKMRLGSYLSASQRALLSEAMLHDLLSALNHCSQLNKIILVGDSDELQQIAERYCVDIFAEAAHHQQQNVGLNAALERAAVFARTHGAQKLCIIHADLPWLTAVQIDALLEQHNIAPSVISLVTDNKACGSNVLILPACSRLKFNFGEKSRSAHQQQARTLNESMRVAILENLSADIDNANDLLILQRKIDEARAKNLNYPKYTQAFLNTLQHECLIMEA